MWFFLAFFLMLPATAANTELVGFWSYGGDTMELYGTQEKPCQNGGKNVTYTLRPPASFVVPGCWIAEGQFIYLEFIDGDAFRMPIQAINWKPGKAPATL